jgi:tetratricopeptide (TPR) repeat protein
MQGILMFEDDEPPKTLTEGELLEKLRNGCDNLLRSLWELATLYAKTNRPTMAFSCLEIMISGIDDIEIKTIWYMKMAITMEEVQNYESALLCYSRVFSLKSGQEMDRYFMNNNMGYCLNQLGRYKEAESYCREAIKIDSRRHNAFKNLGVSLEGQGQYQRAADCYATAATIYPEDPRASKHFDALWLKIRKLG